MIFQLKDQSGPVDLYLSIEEDNCGGVFLGVFPSPETAARCDGALGVISLNTKTVVRCLNELHPFNREKNQYDRLIVPQVGASYHLKKEEKTP